MDYGGKVSPKMLLGSHITKKEREPCSVQTNACAYCKEDITECTAALFDLQENVRNHMFSCSHWN